MKRINAVLAVLALLLSIAGIPATAEPDNIEITGYEDSVIDTENAELIPNNAVAQSAIIQESEPVIMQTESSNEGISDYNEQIQPDNQQPLSDGEILPEEKPDKEINENDISFPEGSELISEEIELSEDQINEQAGLPCQNEQQLAQLGDKNFSIFPYKWGFPSDAVLIKEQTEIDEEAIPFLMNCISGEIEEYERLIDASFFNLSVLRGSENYQPPENAYYMAVMRIEGNIFTPENAKAVVFLKEDGTTERVECFDVKTFNEYDVEREKEISGIELSFMANHISNFAVLALTDISLNISSDIAESPSEISDTEEIGGKQDDILLKEESNEPENMSSGDAEEENKSEETDSFSEEISGSDQAATIQNDGEKINENNVGFGESEIINDTLVEESETELTAVASTEDDRMSEDTAHTEETKPKIEKEMEVGKENLVSQEQSDKQLSGENEDEESQNHDTPEAVESDSVFLTDNEIESLIPKGKVRAIAYWIDSGYERYRPLSLTLMLYRSQNNGEKELVNTVMLPDENRWYYTWENLDSAYSYSVEEVLPGGYSLAVSHEGDTFFLKNTRIVSAASPVSYSSFGVYGGYGTYAFTGSRYLPQTGAVWWPVPILAAAGIVLLIIGLKKRGAER